MNTLPPCGCAGVNFLRRAPFGRGVLPLRPKSFRAERAARSVVRAVSLFPRRPRRAIRCSRRLAIPAPNAPRDLLFAPSRYSRAERAARSVVHGVSLFPRRTRCAICCSRRLAIPAPKSFRADRAAPLSGAAFCRCRTRKNARKSPASRFYALILAFRSFILL